MKLKNPNQWRISRGLWSGFSILSVFLAIVTVIALIQIERSEDDLDRMIDVQVPAEQMIADIESTIAELSNTISNYSIDSAQTLDYEIGQHEDNVETSLDTMMDMVADEEIHFVVEQIAVYFDELVSSNRQIVSIINRLAAQSESVIANIDDINQSVDDRLISQIELDDATAFDKTTNLYQIKNDFSSLSYHIKQYARKPDSQTSNKISNTRSQIEAGILDLQKMDLSDLEKSWMDKIIEDYQEVSDDSDELIMTSDNLRDIITDHQTLSNEILAVLNDEIRSALTGDTNRLYDESSNSSITTKTWILVLAIIGLLVGGGLAIVTTRKIIKSLQNLDEGAKAVANGKLEHRFYIDTGDEFGQIALTLNQMLGNIRRSREAIGESEETAWQLLDSTLDSVFLMNLRGIIVASNEIAAERYGKSLEQMIDMSYYDFLPADLMATRKAQISEVIRTGKPFHLEDDRDGMVLDTRIFPVINPDNGKVVRIAIFARDITTRKWVEEVTESLGKRNELILEAAGEGIYGLDIQGRTTFVNPAAAKMLSYRTGDLIGQYHHELVHHSRANGTPYPANQCPIHAAFRDGIVRTNVDDEVFWRKDGTHFAVEYSSTPIMDDGKIVGAVVTFRDISERKQMEIALRRSDKRYRSIFESNATLIVSVDADGIVIDCNARIQRMLGYLPEEIIGKKLIDIVHRDFHSTVQKSLTDVLVNGFEYDKQHKMKQKDGSQIDVNVNYASLKDEQGQYVRTICMIENISGKVQQ